MNDCTARRRMLAAQRQRKRRALMRGDLIEVKVCVTRQARDLLSDHGLLPEWSEDDPATVGEAVERLLSGLGPVTP